MGQFSWLDCITQEQVVNGLCRDVYVLVPTEFGGGHIKETCYDGYGHFGSYDIFDLVADWNRYFIYTVLNELKPYWKGSLIDLYEKELERFAAGQPITVEKRLIGITLASYDEDNEKLRFPIKITHDPMAVYERCRPSLADQNQGWLIDEDE